MSTIGSQITTSENRADCRRIAQVILNKEADDRLKYYNDGRVKVLIEKIIPDDSVTQTVQGRRKRFRRDLTERLTGHGYKEISSNLYALSGSYGNDPIT